MAKGVGDGGAIAPQFIKQFIRQFIQPANHGASKQESQAITSKRANREEGAIAISQEPQSRGKPRD
jgi:hypothetical protein